MECGDPTVDGCVGRQNSGNFRQASLTEVVRVIGKSGPDPRWSHVNQRLPRRLSDLR
jgi:hypothetical protein